MTTRLVIPIYDRPEFLKQTLQACVDDYPCQAEQIYLYSDGASKEVIDVAQDFVNRHSHVKLIQLTHIGMAEVNSLAMRDAMNEVDTVIRMDADCVVKQLGWAGNMEAMLSVCPEIGILAPDWPGRYMRIERKQAGYDEVEYCLGIIMGIRSSVLKEATNYLGNGFFDRNLHHQFEPDICLRVRMLGYRVALQGIGDFVHLGEGLGDSAKQDRDSNVCKGGYEFLKKWNKRFVGEHFQYKSPMMLRWDEFPPNYLWRRMWLSQFDFSNLPKPVIATIQGHQFELVNFPVTPGKWILKESKEAIEADWQADQSDDYAKVDLDLLTGKRGWRVDDAR